MSGIIRFGAGAAASAALIGYGSYAKGTRTPEDDGKAKWITGAGLAATAVIAVGLLRNGSIAFGAGAVAGAATSAMFLRTPMESLGRGGGGSRPEAPREPTQPPPTSRPEPREPVDEPEPTEPVEEPEEPEPTTPTEEPEEPETTPTGPTVGDDDDDGTTSGTAPTFEVVGEGEKQDMLRQALEEIGSTEVGRQILEDAAQFAPPISIGEASDFDGEWGTAARTNLTYTSDDGTGKPKATAKIVFDPADFQDAEGVRATLVHELIHAGDAIVTFEEDWSNTRLEAEAYRGEALFSTDYAEQNGDPERPIGERNPIGARPDGTVRTIEEAMREYDRQADGGFIEEDDAEAHAPRGANGLADARDGVQRHTSSDPVRRPSGTDRAA